MFVVYTINNKGMKTNPRGKSPSPGSPGSPGVSTGGLDAQDATSTQILEEIFSPIFYCFWEGERTNEDLP